MTTVDSPLRIYIAGPLSADSKSDIQKNIELADAVSRDLIVMGHYVFCPHTQSANHFDDRRPQFVDYRWIVDYHDILGWLRICDAIFMVGDWQESKGALKEYDAATNWSMPVFTDIAQVPPVRCNAYRYKMMEMDETLITERRKILRLHSIDYVTQGSTST